MTIKKISPTELLFETIKSKVNVNLGDKIDLKIETPKQTLELGKPGEYEYEDISITALELTREIHSGQINFVKLTIENMNIGIVTSEVPTDKEIFKDLGNLDILVIKDNFNTEIIKKLMNYFDILSLILMSANEFESIKQDLGLGNITQDKTLKFKGSDFRREESSVINGFVF